MTVPTWPFVGTEALARGAVTSGILQRKYDRVYRNVYVPKGSELTPANRAVAAWLWSGRQSTLAGLSAAAMHGTKWIDPSLPAELYRRNGKPVEGILIHRDELFDDERQLVRGISLTTPARTAFDLGRRRGRTVALIRVDAVANTTGLRPPAIESLIERHAGARGLRQLREVAELMGWLIMRVSADMLRYRREVIVSRTCAALRQAGAEWPVIASILGDRVA